MVLDKNIVREKFRVLRMQHSVDEKRQADQALGTRLSAFLVSFRPKNVLAYRPLKTEANPFSDRMPSEYSYPEVTGEVFHAEIQGVRVSPEKLDMVLIPGIAFDRQGNRLGFGKGYYDRFLKTAAHACRVGIAYSFQVSSEELPREEWDERVEWIVTERYVLRVERKDQRQWKR